MDAGRRASSAKSRSSSYRGASTCTHVILGAAYGLVLGVLVARWAGDYLELCRQACLLLMSDAASASFPGLTKVCGRERTLKGRRRCQQQCKITEHSVVAMDLKM